MSPVTRRGFLMLGIAGLLSACSAVGPAPGTTTSPAQLSTASITAAIEKHSMNARPNGLD